MRFAKQCLLTIIGILRQVFVLSRYRWKKTLLNFVQNHKSAIKTTNWRIVKGFSIAPPTILVGPSLPPTFWTLESPLNRTHAKLDWHVVLFRCFVKTNLSTCPWMATESAVIIFGTMHSKNSRKTTESSRHSRMKNTQPHIWTTFQD